MEDVVDVGTKKLECRIVIGYRLDKKIELGMYDPLNDRYEALGTHGPSQYEIDRVVNDLKKSIITAGHKLTFCERRLT